MNKLLDAMYAAAYKSLAYLFIYFAVLGFCAWIVSKFWIEIIAISIVVIGIRIYLWRRYW